MVAIRYFQCHFWNSVNIDLMIKKDQPVRHILALFGLSRRMSPNKYLHYVHKRNTIQEVDILIKILAYLNAVDTNLTPKTPKIIII